MCAARGAEGYISSIRLSWIESWLKPPGPSVFKLLAASVIIESINSESKVTTKQSR